MRKQLADLRNVMRENGVDAWIVPTTDFHGSEYVNDHFKWREYLSGFTGSAGTLVVTQDAAALWTDGRYFLQAEAQLDGSGITLMREGMPGVPTLAEWLKIQIPGGTVGFDGRVVDLKLGRELEEIFPLRWDAALPDAIWKEHPPLTASEIYALPQRVTGEAAVRKLGRIRRSMREAGADYHLITSLEEIAWIWNLRGRDVLHTPVFYGFMLLTPQETRVYLLNQTKEAAALFQAALQEDAQAEDTTDPADAEHGAGAGEELKILPYFDIFEDLKRLPRGSLLLDESRISYGMAAAVSDAVAKIAGEDPAMRMKAIKNETEIAATRRAHVRDGAAMVRFLYWLKTRMQAQRTAAGKECGREQPAAEQACRKENMRPLTEIGAAAQLEAERRREGAQDSSFDTIAGYGPHGAIVHYEATPQTDAELAARGFLLVDSGGQYPDGTTDITRTIALGPLTEKMKRCYTAVLKSHIALAAAVFDETTTGADLDQAARGLLQAQGLDYRHGTGHGVGHLLSVHEGPQTISPRGKDCHILPGMITSNEPGVYLEGEFGIRLENEILCREARNTENDEAAGKKEFCFETLTDCPFEREAILPELLTEPERSWLNAYHRQVYETLAPLLEPDVRKWLAEQTAPLEGTGQA